MDAFLGETDEKGMRTVFFELNGQPRRIKYKPLKRA